MAAVLGRLRAAGFSEATLWVAEENRRPRSVYKAAGWTEDGKAKEMVYLGVTFKALRYRISL
jgi:hypothetical protein